MTIPALWNVSWTPALINHLWQSTIVAGIAWLLSISLRKYSARVRYWVWFAASIKFLLPFSLLITAGEWLRSWLPEQPASQPTVAGVVEQMALPFAPAQGFDATAAPVAAHGVNWMPTVLLAIWACGALLVAARFVRGWQTAYAAKRAARPLKLATDVPVLCSPARIEPGIFGIFRPVLLLPDGIQQRLTKEQFAAIIEHEMCHVRRRDNFTYAIHMIVETLFWFHPLAWWIGARLIDERERACDEAVVQAGSMAEIYAESILSVCKFYIESPLACVSGITGADLKKRIARIMSNLAIRKIGLAGRLLILATPAIAIAAPVALGVIHTVTANAKAAAAQDIAGIWQGTLHDPQANRDLRTEIRIVKVDAGAYKATFYSLDQGWLPLQTSGLTFENGELKFSLVGLGGMYEGKMSDDWKTITGSWTHGANPMSLVLVRTTSDDAWPVPEPIKSMVANANPKFDVITIKPCPPGKAVKKLGFDGHSFHMRGMNLNDMIAIAYGLHTKQIVGAPAWATTDFFNVEGIPDVPGIPDQKQRQSLVRNLLTDRLQLKFHREKRRLAVYTITMAGGGPKMTKTTAEPNDPQGFGFTMKPNIQGVTLHARNLTIADLATWMQGFVMDRPVVDQTELTDRYDFDLKWMPDDSQFLQFSGTGLKIPPSQDNANTPPGLYTAVQEQLGLKIEATKALDDVMVIDHVEQPSPN